MLAPLDGLEVHPVTDHVPQRGHVAQPPHLLHSPLHCVENLLVASEPSDPEPGQNRTIIHSQPWSEQERSMFFVFSRLT